MVPKTKQINAANKERIQGSCCYSAIAKKRQCSIQIECYYMVAQDCICQYGSYTYIRKAIWQFYTIRQVHGYA
jgi:hypothetical protein